MKQVYSIQQQRQTHQAYYQEYGSIHPEVIRRSRWARMVLAASAVLVGVGVWIVLLIYGPVVAVEAQYQARSLGRMLGRGEGSRLSFLVPDFSFKTPPVKIGNGVGIVIPKIFVKEVAVVNVDPTDKRVYLPALDRGIAHAAGTALPGDEGLGYYFAHSSGLGGTDTGFNAVFYLLGKLTTGDEVWLYRNGEKFAYRVIRSEIMSAEEVSFLDEGGGERVVLQTCWPVGTSAKRLVVTAERVG